MLDYGIFYEFVPVEELGGPAAAALVANVELDRALRGGPDHAAGLWSYVLGDTVRFVARDPLRLVITGRTRHFVNAFGENVIVEEVERALLAACADHGAELVEFTVAPRVPGADREPAAVTTGRGVPVPPADEASSRHSTYAPVGSTRTTAPSEPATWAWLRRA